MPIVSICIDVPDIEKATKFYTEVVGCKVKMQKENSTEMSVDNSTIYLIEREENSNPLIGDSDSRRYTRHWTPVHLDFHVTDIDKAMSLVHEFGGKLEGKEEGDWGTAAFCADPFGNGFCMIKMNT